jgi:hypothetical protein
VDTLTKIKQAIRRTHSKLDEDLQADIDACIADLRSVGIVYADETDPLIYNAIKLWCRSLDADDVAKAAEFMRRYEALKGSLMMAEGYGRAPEGTDHD